MKNYVVIEINFAWNFFRENLLGKLRTMHYGFCFIAFRMVFIPCYKALYMLLQSTTCMENIYGFFYSFGYKLNADIASPSFWVGWSIISFDSTNKLIDGPVVIFIHFVINGLMHGFYTRYIFFLVPKCTTNIFISKSICSMTHA